MNYSSRLRRCAREYPFDFWFENYQEGIGLYSESHCRHLRGIFDDLIEDLILLGEEAEEKCKLDEFEVAVRRLNEVRKMNPALIETMEREEFCELFDVIALSSGINPKDYGGGEGVASEWREW
ncbi:MAG: hypothetical protein R3351_05760 [Nitrospirales bacterium]|nr:hypothetical protein [Nitrospirales bacterium]